MEKLISMEELQMLIGAVLFLVNLFTLYLSIETKCLKGKYGDWLIMVSLAGYFLSAANLFVAATA